MNRCTKCGTELTMTTSASGDPNSCPKCTASPKPRNEGGMAFPVPLAYNPNTGAASSTGEYWDGNGMSLRQWYAGMAMQGMLTNGFQPNMVKQTDPAAFDYAKAAFEMADAMIAEGAK